MCGDVRRPDRQGRGAGARGHCGDQVPQARAAKAHGTPGPGAAARTRRGRRRRRGCAGARAAAAVPAGGSAVCGYARHSAAHACKEGHPQHRPVACGTCVFWHPPQAPLDGRDAGKPRAERRRQHLEGKRPHARAQLARGSVRVARRMGNQRPRLPSGPGPGHRIHDGRSRRVRRADQRTLCGADGRRRGVPVLGRDVWPQPHCARAARAAVASRSAYSAPGAGYRRGPRRAVAQHRRGGTPRPGARDAAAHDASRGGGRGRRRRRES
mmetsp:Transcript_34950/g.103538  ORF Transcript_34950/g.103538 Transcript_34950/m.103538 type:complete len:268 (+) Transcript_34950:2073-2876(+)